MRKVTSALLLGLAVTASSMAMAQDRDGDRWRGRPQAQATPTPQAAPARPADNGRGGRFQGERRDGAAFGARVDNQERGGQRVDIQRPGRPDGQPVRVDDQRRDGQRWNDNDRRFGDRRPDGQQLRIDNQRRDDPRWRGGNDDRRFVDRNRSGWNDGRNDGRGLSWNRGWRSDRRYDWQGYRDYNRNAFRMPRYVAPYNYGYRRFSAGIRLEPFFFSQRYWINDPYAYRLPPAYEPYRWVRYYDDVLLVDLRTGEVVDVIPDFFW